MFFPAPVIRSRFSTVRDPQRNLKLPAGFARRTKVCHRCHTVDLHYDIVQFSAKRKGMPTPRNLIANKSVIDVAVGARVRTRRKLLGMS